MYINNIQFFDNTPKDMTNKYSYENYTITVDFKNDFSLAITASDIYSGDYFINETVQLTKIKKDTIIATLTRKNEKSLKCLFNVVDVQPKKLILAFEVSFDYLPTFSEYISLDQIEKKGKGLNKVESAELKSDLQDLDKMISNMTSKESVFAIENNNNTYNSKGEIFMKDLERGSYLFEASGQFVCPNGVISKHDLVFTIEVGGTQYNIECCMHTNGGYGYPFSIRKDFILSQPGKIIVSVTHKQNQSFNIYNSVITICPMIRVR